MKLKSSHERRSREQARHLLIPEVTHEEIVFDPLAKLPISELAHLAQQPENELTYDQKVRVMSSAWLGILDNEYHEALRASPWLKAFWERHCYQYLPPASMKLDFNTIKATCSKLAPFLQIFPDERSNLRLNTDNLNTLLYDFNGSDLGEQLHLGVCLSQVFPDQQNLIANTLYRRHFTPQKYAESALYYLPGKVDLAFVSDTLHLPAFMWRMADVFLLFPEERAHYTALVQKLAQELRHECLEVAPKPGLGQTREGIFFDRIFSLTILAAHEAHVVPSGALEITLRSRPFISGAPLPPRAEL